jgi:hypothetical protein
VPVFEELDDKGSEANGVFEDSDFHRGIEGGCLNSVEVHV